MFLRALLVLTCITVASAGLSGGRLQTKPDKFKDVEGCYFQDLDAVIPFGSSAPAKSYCAEYRCGRQNYVEVTCSPGVTHDKKAKPGCHTIADKEKPFPDCCPVKVCGPEE